MPKVAEDPKIVNLVAGVTPDDYHCTCKFCSEAIGELRPKDGTYYSRLERRKYYDKSESGKSGHIAKTPLHVARWAIQRYSKRGDWVLDPTIGAGTTAVESLTQGRNVAGMELQFGEILKANVAKNKTAGVEALIRLGDARKIGDFLVKIDKKFTLVVNNPPYSGDEHAGIGDGVAGSNNWTTSYEDGLPNLAFLKEGDEYWSTMRTIYSQCIQRLLLGGYFVIGIKDMMRRKKPFLLHLDFCNMMESMGMKSVGTAFLKHYPPTLFLNTYEKMYGIRPPLYQTINVFRKVKK